MQIGDIEHQLGSRGEEPHVTNQRLRDMESGDVHKIEVRSVIVDFSNFDQSARDAVAKAVTGTVIELTRQMDVTAAALAKALGGQAAKFSAKPETGPAGGAKPAPGARSEAPKTDAKDLVAAEWAGNHPDLLVGSETAVDDAVWRETDWMVSVDDSRKQSTAGAITAGLLVAGFLTPGWVRDQMASVERQRKPVARLKNQDGE